MLAQMQKNVGQRFELPESHGGNIMLPPQNATEDCPTYGELGIGYTQAHRWQSSRGSKELKRKWGRLKLTVEIWP